MPESIRVVGRAAGGPFAVSALRYEAAEPSTAPTVVLAHGAGAPQTSDFMVGFPQALARHGFPTVTFNFPYMEEGRRLPDRSETLEACFRAVIAAVRERVDCGASRLVIGGKSLGGRMASHVAAAGLDDLAGLVFLGYPLHPPGQPRRLRAAHLARIRQPMLFVQGTRDPFGTPEELAPLLAPLGPAVRVHVVPDGDHSFKVPKRGPEPQERVFALAQDEIARWLRGLG